MVKASYSNNHAIWGALLALAGLSLSSSARADSLSCGGRIVSTGDSRYDVKSICGEPDDVSQHVEYRSVRGRVSGPCARDSNGKLRCQNSREEVVEVVVDEWIYDFGSNRFVEYLTFEQGHLLTVRDGSYGHKAPR
jgi:hypothetical protein